VQAVQQYLQYLLELQALARQAEKLARGAEMEYTGGDGGSFLHAATQAVEAFSSATGYVMALEALAAGGGVPSAKLLRQGAGLAARVGEAGAALRGLLGAAAQQLLHQCAWPPPLTAEAAAGGGGGGGGDGGGASPVGGEAGGWDGFAAAGERVVQELQGVFIVLLTLQRATQHAAFAAAGPDPPLLWPAEELAAGVAERLNHHFAQGLPTDRADAPEWLFSAAVAAARRCAPHAEAFQPAVEAHGLQAGYSMQLEAARAVHAVGVAPLLRAHVLPRLAALQDAPTWLHYADAAVAYERQMAALRGAAPAVAAAAVDDDEAAAAAAHAGSAVEVVFEREEWREGWLQAELWDAQRQLEAACEAPDAWAPPPAAAALGQLHAGGDGAGLGGGAADDRALASSHEFWPPACAEAALALVAAAAARGAWVAGPANCQAYVKAVPQAVLKAFRARLAALLATADHFNDLLGEAWLPRVGAAACAAHFVEHALREPQGGLLAALSGGAGAAPLGAALEREAAALGTMRRQAAYKLAKLAVDQFQVLFSPYKRDPSPFAAGYDADAPPGRRQPPSSALQPPAGPSPRLLAAADGLQRTLGALGAHLDAVAFRDVWRAAALAVNYAFFNDVATEARFSSAGALQAEADCAALQRVFAGCTARPAAHFKESREACRLLLLDPGAAAQLAAALGEGRGEALAGSGVRALNAEQAASVLAQRLDLAEDGRGGGGWA
jgi:hypothetical protein